VSPSKFGKDRRRVVVLLPASLLAWVNYLSVMDQRTISELVEDALLAKYGPSPVALDSSLDPTTPPPAGD
jgi:hypothetical protein